MAFFVFLAPDLAVNLRHLGSQDSIDKDQQSLPLPEGLLPASRKYPEKKYQIKDVEHRRSDIKRLSANLMTTIGLMCFVGVHFIDSYALPIGHGAQPDTMATRRPYSPEQTTACFKRPAKSTNLGIKDADVQPSALDSHQIFRYALRATLSNRLSVSTNSMTPGLLVP